MEISFSDKVLRRYAEEPTFARQRLGVEIAKKYTLRIMALRAAKTLGVFFPPFSGPERCHEFNGSVGGVFSVDLKQPHRLLFASTEAILGRPDVDPKRKWESVTSVTIIEIKDAHE